jgi:hypothetical protein
MAVLTKIPAVNNATVMTDIRDTLNANDGIATDNLVTFFTKAANLNMWSRRKPVIANKTGTLTDAEMASAGLSFSFYNSVAKFGLTIVGGKGVTPKTLYQSVASIGSGIVYYLPQGGESQPLRLSDFNGYYPAAIQPLRGSLSGVVTIDPLTGSSTYDFQYFKSTAGTSSDSLSFDDLYQSKDENGNTITWRTGLVLVNKSNADDIRVVMDSITKSFTDSNKGKSFYALQFITSLLSGTLDPAADSQLWKDCWQYPMPDATFELVIRNTSSGGSTGIQSSILVSVTAGYPKFIGLDDNPYSDVSMKFTLRVVGGNGNVSNFSVGLYKEASCTNRVSYQSFSNIVGLTGERAFSALLPNPGGLTDLYVGIFFNGNLQNVNKVAMPIVKPTFIE